MSIIFSNGFSVTPPIITGMRSFLSVAGQTAYDAATVGNFFSCSLADYNAVFAGYADAQKIGNTDVIFNTSLNTSYSGGCASVLPIGNSTIPANTYIIGFATKMISTPLSTTVTPLISTAYKGTYTAISNSPTIAGTNRVYYLRKDPPITSVTSYVGHVSSGGSSDFDQTTTTYTNAGFDCTAPYSSWNNRTGQMPHFQMFVTTTRPY
jgi:hypothetical protein